MPNFDVDADTLVVAELAGPVNVAEIVEGEVAVWHVAFVEKFFRGS